MPFALCTFHLFVQSRDEDGRALRDDDGVDMMEYVDQRPNAKYNLLTCMIRPFFPPVFLTVAHLYQSMLILASSPMI